MQRPRGSRQQKLAGAGGEDRGGERRMGPADLLHFHKDSKVAGGHCTAAAV